MLTDEQVENWRRVLCGMIGPYALIMTREQIEAYRDKIQASVDQYDTAHPDPACPVHKDSRTDGSE